MFQDDYIVSTLPACTEIPGMIWEKGLMLSKRERERYSRQLPLIGEEGQERLHDASVCVAGAGGLGSPVLLYLAAAGVGHLRLVDPDRVERSNLNRQVLHAEPDISRFKVESAADKLRALNPEITIEALPVAVNSGNVSGLAAGMDLLLDALDNYEARYLLNRAALDRGIPLVHAAVNGFFGQMTTIVPGETACLQCALPHPPEGVDASIIGVTAGIIGLLQALEAIKILIREGELAKNVLVVWDGRCGRLDQIPLVRDPACMACGAGDGS
ncbi:MAG: putative adenylyltransferase [Methanoregulaceae archaeon PtaB.Bin056]|jgi:adenylyltransferase/sulfurtransferase|nr:MAG: putative adenylyltransferase [Methanoregulaceae archaeon PtaB.Bin056]